MSNKIKATYLCFTIQRILWLADAIDIAHHSLADRFTLEPSNNYSSWLGPFLPWVPSYNNILDFLGLDPGYIQFVQYVFAPLVIAFVLPLLLLACIYGSSIFLHIYQLRHRLKAAYATGLWDGGRTSLASFWDAHGKIWHGYEVDGLERLPDSGAAMIVFYHGVLPLDVLYLVAKVILKKRRTIKCVIDNFHFRIPGLQLLCEVAGVTAGTVDGCVDLLKQGHIICVSPGGVREAMFGDPATYALLWANRMGFAKVAVQAKVPVIPMFTENYREAYRTTRCGRRFFRWLYEKTRLPIIPVYGGFPVKLITHLGAPIDFSLSLKHQLSDNGVGVSDSGDGDDKDDVIAARHLIQVRLERLIANHQRLPGSIWRAMLARILPSVLKK